MIDSESAANNNLNKKSNANATQPFDLTLDLIQNANNSSKRLSKQDDTLAIKRMKNNDYENEVLESSISSLHHKWSSAYPLSSSPMKTNSKITIGRFHLIPLKHFTNLQF